MRALIYNEFNHDHGILKKSYFLFFFIHCILIICWIQNYLKTFLLFFFAYRNVFYLLVRQNFQMPLLQKPSCFYSFLFTIFWLFVNFLGLPFFLIVFLVICQFLQITQIPLPKFTQENIYPSPPMSLDRLQSPDYLFRF